MLPSPAHKTHVDNESITIYLTSCISHHFDDLRYDDALPEFLDVHCEAE